MRRYEWTKIRTTMPPYQRRTPGNDPYSPTVPVFGFWEEVTGEPPTIGGTEGIKGPDGGVVIIKES